MITFLHINILQYISVRAGVGFFIALFLTMYLMPKFIAWAAKKGASQPIFELAPSAHQKKSNTPTMGGVVFVFATIIAVLISAKLNSYVTGAILTLFLFSLIGIKDDYSKIASSDNQAGFSPKGKMAALIAAAFLVSVYVYFFTPLGSSFYIPFYKHPLFDMGIFALLFWILVFISSSNAVNLTDGLDGLATVPSIFSVFTLSVFLYLCGNAIFSSYLFLPKLIGVGEVAIVGASLMGALIGFLWSNCHPAEVFMGDTGSLSLGAIIAYMSIITKNEILLILIGSVFVLEAISVIVQVGSFRTRKKRVLLMAPIHHHFEIKGWAENKIIVRFWILALLSNLLALITIKIR